MAYKMLMPGGREALWVTAAELAQLRAMAPMGEATAGGAFYGLPVYVIPEPKRLTRWLRIKAWFVARWKDWTLRIASGG